MSCSIQFRFKCLDEQRFSDQKTRVRVRVRSARKTVAYGLGKILTNRLSHIRQSVYTEKDSFDFVNKIISSSHADKMMVSFDVTSLFTKVPLTFIINYILDRMYSPCSSPFAGRTKKCMVCRRRPYFETLLSTIVEPVR